MRSFSPPRISPSCAAPRIRRSLPRRPPCSALPASPSPTATRSPASCAAISRRRRPARRYAVGCRLVFRDGTPDIAVWPPDRAAYGRLCRLLTTGNLRTRKGECHLDLADLLEWGEGLEMAVLPGARLGRRLRERRPPPGGGFRAGKQTDGEREAGASCSSPLRIGSASTPISTSPQGEVRLRARALVPSPPSPRPSPAMCGSARPVFITATTAGGSRRSPPSPRAT